MNLDTAANPVADDPLVDPPLKPQSGTVGRAGTAGAAGTTSGVTAASSELAAFVGEHYDRLLRLAWLVCRDSGDAADAVQTGFEAAWRHRESLRDGSRIRPWLDRVVVRESSRIAKRRRSWLARLISPRPELAWIEPSHQPMTRRDDVMTLRAALARLSPDHRAVVALHLHAGYSVAETAELVGAPLETVRSRLRVAKDHLRRDLGEKPR